MLKKAFEALCLAQVARRITSVAPAGLPLGASASVKVFKALMLDLGLMRYLSGMPDDIDGIIHPVEVKSGATGSLRSLHLFLASYPECGTALVFSDQPYSD